MGEHFGSSQKFGNFRACTSAGEGAETCARRTLLARADAVRQARERLRSSSYCRANGGSARWALSKDIDASKNLARIPTLKHRKNRGMVM